MNENNTVRVTNLDVLREVLAEVHYKVRNGMSMHNLDRLKYILMIKAVSKQIPEKPFGKSPYECPFCGKIVHKEMKCCNECGQALDWSVDNG